MAEDSAALPPPPAIIPHVLVVGGGFGGLTAARSLASAPVRVTLVDRTNRHTFQPLLYQVAMAGLSPADIAQPIRAVVHRQANVTVLMADVVAVDPQARVAQLDDGERLAWDYLILACGAETSYFRHPEWRRSAPALKSIEDAVEIRQRVLLAFELAERDPDPQRRRELLSFVVIGGGPTGVELAGALAELSKFALSRDFRRIDPSVAKVRIIEAGDRLLASFPRDLSESAARQLEELGVEVRAGARVTAIESGAVRLGDERIACSLVLWAAGVRANALTRTLGAPLDSGGRVRVEKDLSIPGHPNAFVIGDAARFDDAAGQPLPGVSPVAMQQGRAAARNVRRAIAGQRSEPFTYLDKGSMATIGRSRAVAAVGRIHLTGFVAWFAWLVVHIWYLIGFKNRLIVMIVWAWSYFTYRRGARLIAGYAAGDWRIALATPAKDAADDHPAATTPDGAAPPHPSAAPTAGSRA